MEIITINGGCSLFVPGRREFEVTIHNLGDLKGVKLQPLSVLSPKQAQAAAKPPSNRPRYGYSCLEFTSYRDIKTTPPINS